MFMLDSFHAGIHVHMQCSPCFNIIFQMNPDLVAIWIFLLIDLKENL